MDIGMPTLLEADSIEACASLCQRLGLDFLELNMNLPQYQCDAIDIPALRAVGERYGIYFTLHLDENLNPFDFNRDVARAYAQTALRAIDIAVALGVPVVNMHLNEGVYFTLPDRKAYLFERYKAHYLSELAAFRDMCAAAVGNRGIAVCVENTGWHNKGFVLEGVETLLQSDAFGLTYDVGHDYSNGGFDLAFFLAHEERLRHMHLHDAVSGRNHLTLGSGQAPIGAALDLAACRGCRVVLETKTIAALEESVHWLERHRAGAAP